MPAPSIWAASSISLGTSWMKPIRSQIATGSLAAVCAMTSAHLESSIPKLAKTAKSGIARAITGIMRMISRRPMMTLNPGSRKREMA